jgi:type IV fimbrial biogenesis protein FimT
MIFQIGRLGSGWGALTTKVVFPCAAGDDTLNVIGIGSGAAAMKHSGVTLMEMVVVLAIISILFAIAVPGYAYLASTNRIAAATNDLVTSLQLARSEAIRRATRVTVCKSDSATYGAPSCNTGAAWQDGWIVFVDGGGKGVIDATDEILRVEGPVHVTFTTSNFKTYVSYLGHGRSQGPNGLATGSFTLCVAGIQRKLILNNTGRIRLTAGKC